MIVEVILEIHVDDFAWESDYDTKATAAAVANDACEVLKNTYWVHRAYVNGYSEGAGAK